MTLKIFTSKLPCIPSYSHVKCKLWTDYDKIMKVYLVWERWSGVSNGRVCWYLTCASEQVSLWFASLTVERTTELTTETWDSSHQHSKHEQSCYLTSPGLCCLSLNWLEMMTRLAGTWITSDCLVVCCINMFLCINTVCKIIKVKGRVTVTTQQHTLFTSVVFGRWVRHCPSTLQLDHQNQQ